MKLEVLPDLLNNLYKKTKIKCTMSTIIPFNAEILLAKDPVGIKFTKNDQYLDIGYRTKKVRNATEAIPVQDKYYFISSMQFYFPYFIDRFGYMKTCFISLHPSPLPYKDFIKQVNFEDLYIVEMKKILLPPPKYSI